jgi:putative flippase GtrA
MLEKKIKSKKVRFGLVGVINSVIDFSILFTLVQLGVVAVVANFFSTFAAFCFSFIANRSFTFNAKDGSSFKQAVLFIVITLTGIWLIQPIVLLLAIPGLENVGASYTIAVFIAKVIAAAIALVWNYVLYSKIVFKNNVT